MIPSPAFPQLMRRRPRAAAASGSVGPSRTGPRRRLPTVGGVAVVAVAVAVLVPAAAVALQAVTPRDAQWYDALARILSSGRTWRVVAATVAQAAVSCALTVVVGVPVAWVLERYRFRGRSAVRVLATVPFVLPSVVVAAAIAAVLGPSGLVDARGTWWPILAAHLCFNLAVVVRTVGAALAALDPDLEPSARLLGAGPVSAALRVQLPAVVPAVAAAAVVVFLFCLTSFGVIVVLGGGATTTVEVEIWTRATRQFDLPGAGVLAVLQLVAVVATLSVHAAITRRGHGTTKERGGAGRRPAGAGDRAAVLLAVALVLVISLVPLLAVLDRSFLSAGRRTVTNWTHLGSATAGTGLSVSPLDAVAASLRAAGVAAALAVGVAVAAVRAVARRPGGPADRVLLLPLGVSATTLGLGLLLVAGRPPLDLRRSWWLVPVAQALVAIPLVVRVVLPSLRGLPGSMLDAAALLGAGPRARWWRVELPMLRRALGAGAALAVIACLGEFGATVFVARTTDPTMPVAIERLMSRPGGAGFGQAMALSCLLVLVCAAVISLVDRWARSGDGEALTF